MEDKNKEIIEKANGILKKVRDSLFQLFEEVEQVQDLVDQIAGLPPVEEDITDEEREERDKSKKVIKDFAEIFEELRKQQLPQYPQVGKHVMFPYGDEENKRWISDPIGKVENPPRIVWGTTTTDSAIPDTLKRFAKGYTEYKARVG